MVISACFWRGAPYDCLRAWAEGKCPAVISPPLLAEYEATFEELRLDYPGRECVDWVSALRDAAELVFPIDRVQGLVTDPFDEMVLECAWAGEVDMIVTGDKKHLLPLGQFREIPILTPAEFFQRLSITE